MTTPETRSRSFLSRLAVRPFGVPDGRAGWGNVALYAIAVAIVMGVLAMRRIIVGRLSDLREAGDPLPSAYEFLHSLARIETARMVCIGIGGACIVLALIWRKRVRGSVLGLTLIIAATAAAVALPALLVSDYENSVDSLRTHAIRLLKEGRHDHCVEYAHSVERIVARTDTADDIKAAMGGALFHLGKYEEAQERIAAMLSAHPDSDVRDAAIQTLGWTMARLGRLKPLQECRAAFDRLGLSQHGLSLANYLIQYGNLPPRVQDFGTWQNTRPEDPRVAHLAQDVDRRAVLMDNVSALADHLEHDPLVEEAAFRAGREDLLEKATEGGLVARLFHFIRGQRALERQRYTAAQRHFSAFLGRDPMRSLVTTASRGLVQSMCRRVDGTEVVDTLVESHGGRVRGLNEECIALIVESFAFSRSVEEMAHVMATHYASLPLGLRAYLLAVLRERIFLENRPDLDEVIARARKEITSQPVAPILKRHGRRLGALRHIQRVWTTTAAQGEEISRPQDLIPVASARLLDASHSQQHILDATFQLTRLQMNRNMGGNYDTPRNNLYTDLLAKRLTHQVDVVLEGQDDLEERWRVLAALAGKTRFIDDIVSPRTQREVRAAILARAPISPELVEITVRPSFLRLLDADLRSRYVYLLASQDALREKKPLEIATRDRYGLSDDACNEIVESFIRTKSRGAPVMLGLLGRMKASVDPERLDRLADMWLAGDGPVDQVVARTLLGWHDRMSTEALGRVAARLAGDDSLVLEKKTMRKLGEVARHLPPKQVMALASRNLDLTRPINIEKIAPHIDRAFGQLSSLLVALNDRRIESDLVKELAGLVEVAMNEAIYAEEWTERTVELAVALERILRGAGSGGREDALFHRPALQRDIVSRVFDMYVLLAKSRDDKLDRKAMIDIATLCLRHRALLPEAERSFRAYLEMFPKDPLRENCHSWLAWIACFRAYEHSAVPHMYMRYYRRALTHYGWIIEHGRQARVVLNARTAAHEIRKKLARVEQGEVMPHAIRPPAEITNYLDSHRTPPRPRWRRHAPRHRPRMPGDPVPVFPDEPDFDFPEPPPDDGR